ncbi:MAG: class I SAM-dependent methyltransferase [Acidimicrobiia bacterium]|nr:class I SAM-dependent methyltransferase [Acidimicrobiia bacterium]
MGIPGRRHRRPPTLVVDEPTSGLDLRGGTLLVRGWALDASRTDPGTVTVTVGDRVVPTRRRTRPDVAQAEQLPAETPVGFVAAVDRRSLPAHGELRVRALFGRRAVDSAPVPFTNELAEPVPTVGVDHCPVCGSSARHPVGSSDGLRMACCRDCAVVYTVDRPEPGFLAARYSAYYFTDEYLPALDAEPVEMAEHWTRLLDRIEPHRAQGARLFEIGCGAGRFLAAARQRGWAVAGADINESAVEHGRRELNLDLSCRAADEPIDGAGPFDAVVSEMSLEHVPHPAAVMATVAAGLRPGGVVLVFTVSAEGPSFTELGMASPLVGPAEHLLLFSDRALRRLADQAGLETLETWTDASGDGIGLVARRPG